MTVLNSCIDSTHQQALTFTQFASFSGTIVIQPTIYDGYNTTNDWTKNCSAYSSWQGNLRMKLVMGAVVDYFRPVSNTTTLCEMLKANDKHQFSLSPTSFWQT
jgi:hypothetical protein